MSYYEWGVFRLGKTEAAYVNRYFKEMVYPSMLKGGFKSKQEAEAWLKALIP